MDFFEQECFAVGQACAAARMRLDGKAPEAFKKAFSGYQGPRSHLTGYFERKSLSLRLSALKRGMVVDPSVTPAFLERVVSRQCPVTFEPFDVNSRSPRNPSLDRLVNEVTYLAGNVCALSLRANRAKGEKPFEEVADIAQAGKDRDGLEAVEWMRLASLMYGAWSRAFKQADPYLMPLAAIPGAGMFMSTSQAVQLLLTRHYGRDSSRVEEATRRWLSLTGQAPRSEDRFVELQTALAAALAEEDYPGNAWLHSGVFDAFTAWYGGACDAVVPAVEALLQHHQERRSDPLAEVDWPAESQYQH